MEIWEGHSVPIGNVESLWITSTGTACEGNDKQIVPSQHLSGRELFLGSGNKHFVTLNNALLELEADEGIEIDLCESKYCQILYCRNEIILTIATVFTALHF